MLTASTGFHRTADGGATWNEANHCETSFTDGEHVKPIVVDHDAIFAFIDRSKRASAPRQSSLPPPPADLDRAMAHRLRHLLP